MNIKFKLFNFKFKLILIEGIYGNWIVINLFWIIFGIFIIKYVDVIIGVINVI